MSDFVLIFGPSAVGKMTVGQELSRLSAFPLFHNHLTVDTVSPVFAFGTESYRRLVFNFRTEMFEEAVSAELSGLIFTFVWPLDSSESSEMVESWCRIFRKGKWSITFVELRASLRTRIERNRSVNRLLHKGSKRNLAFSEFLLRKNEEEWRANSSEGEAFPLADRHVIVDTERFEPRDAATEIYASLCG